MTAAHPVTPRLVGFPSPDRHPEWLGRDYPRRILEDVSTWILHRNPSAEVVRIICRSAVQISSGFDGGEVRGREAVGFVLQVDVRDRAAPVWRFSGTLSYRRYADADDSFAGAVIQHAGDADSAESLPDTLRNAAGYGRAGRDAACGRAGYDAAGYDAAG